MGVYAGTLSQETQIRIAMKLALSQITTNNGYFNDIGPVYDDIPANPETIPKFPAVVPKFGFDQVRLFDNDVLMLDSDLYLLCYVKTIDSATDAIESFKCDVQTAIGRNTYLPNANGVPTVQKITYRNSMPFGKVLDKPQAGILMGFKLQFQQYITDPTKDV